MDQYYEEMVTNICTSPVMEQLQGVDHFVLPTVGIKEGVWVGSQGPVLYLNQEFGKGVSNWDHKPAVVWHPKKNGKPWTAADKEMINKYRTGILLDTGVKNKKLTFNTWVEANRIKELSKKVYDKIQKGEKVEVSTGMVMDLEKKVGVWNGKRYNAIARNILPDHLAILPDSVGACSVSDGAGLNVTNEAGMSVNPSELLKLLDVIDEEPRSKVAEIINRWLVENELSFTAIQREISTNLAAKFGEKGRYWDGYIRDLFDDRVIFLDSDRKLYEMEYSIKDDAVVLSGDRKEVQAVLQYQPVANETPVENKKMANDPKRVAKIIATEGSGYEEADKQFLIDLDEKQFAKIEKLATTVTNTLKEDEEEETPQKTGSISGKKKRKLSEEEALKRLPPRMRRVVENGIKADQKERARCITIITNAKGNRLKKERLENEDLFSTEDLQDMAAQIETLVKVANKKKHQEEDEDDLFASEDEDYTEDEDEEDEEDEDEEDEGEPVGKASGIGQAGGRVHANNERASSGFSMIPKAIDYASLGKK